MNKLFLVVNQDVFFLSHRKEIATRAQQTGYEVTIIANDTGKGGIIRSMGLEFINLPINKTGVNIFEDLKTLFFLYRLFKAKNPDIVHLVGVKAILWGGLAARFCGIKAIVSAVSGLGVLFSPEYNNGVKKLLSQGVLFVMRYIHRGHKPCCIFHNLDDLNLFISKRVITKHQAFRTMGSGIDLSVYKYKEESKSDKIKVLFTARMVEDKGVLVLIEAANILRDEYEDKVQFILCGGLETNPHAINKETLDLLCDGNYILWLGKRNDIHQQLEQCHIFAFPSYYKEGLPKSCIEASAIGRPIITCNSTGCKDTIIDGKTGFLIPIKDSYALAMKLQCLIDNPSIRQEMGRCARRFAEEHFSIEDVINIHLNIYNRLSSPK